MDRTALDQWENWSGSVSFDPRALYEPADEDELRELVARAGDEGRQVRVVGSGHSATGILETDDLLVTLDRLSGVADHDGDSHEATVLAGTTLGEAGNELLEYDLGMPNFGDVSTQTLAGAISTGTHGTGKDLPCLSTMLIGGRMVTADGDVRTFDADSDPQLLRAARVSLGTLGILTHLRLDLRPSYKLQRREYCTSWRDAEAHIPDLVEQNRNFDFYWYPRSDEVKLRLLNPPGGGTDHEAIDEYATLTEDRIGWAHQIIPKHSHIPRKFDEMEYAVPFEDGLACFREVRDRVRDEWRHHVGWRLLWRTVAPDDSYLSPSRGRETVTVSLHQNAELDYEAYFSDVEPILRAYDGRPHWAKKHSLRAPELRELYPEWDRFQQFRAELDPDGVFTSDYLQELLGEVGQA
ncbi:MAG: D-arabinono-1,4-lactone oxidase [Haloarculaceae archaeon]